MGLEVETPGLREPSQLQLSGAQMTSLVVAACMGFSSQILMPMWIGQVIDGYHTPAPIAARIASAEMFLVAATSVVVAMLLGRLPRARLPWLGMLLLVAGNFLCIYLDTSAGLLACRALTGIGKGLLVAALFSIAGQTVRPTKTFALLNGAYAAVSAAAFLAAPYFVARFGPRGIFALMTCLALVGVAFLPGLPRGAVPALSRARLTLRIPPAGLAVIAAFFFFWTAHEMVWTFAERLGVRIGLDLPAIGQVLAASALAAVAGPVLAHILELRHGVLRPLVAAIVIVALSAWAIAQTHSAALFIVAVLVLSILTLFATPYFQGLLATADPSGRLAALSVATSTAGGSFGALVGAQVLDLGGYGALGPAACAILAGVLWLVLVTRLGHTRAPAASSGTVPDSRPTP